MQYDDHREAVAAPIIEVRGVATINVTALRFFFEVTWTTFDLQRKQASAQPSIRRLALRVRVDPEVIHRLFTKRPLQPLLNEESHSKNPNTSRSTGVVRLLITSGYSKSGRPAAVGDACARDVDQVGPRSNGAGV